jgi:hypothetical protein
MSSLTDENVSPGTSPPAKKERLALSPPRIPEEFRHVREVLCYDKETVDELFAHFVRLVEKTENEVLYWSTLYEESQKELFEIKEKLRTNEKEEADYIDPEAIPNSSRRNSKQPIEEGTETPSGGSRWGLFRGVLNAVVGNNSQEHN